MRSYKRRIIVAVIALVAVYIYWGAIPDPRMNLASLKGMTPQQVISRLGPPRVDQRLPKFGGWTPAQQQTVGPLAFYYYDNRWRGFEYAIIFNNNQVSDVKIGTK